MAGISHGKEVHRSMGCQGHRSVRSLNMMVVLRTVGIHISADILLS